MKNKNVHFYLSIYLAIGLLSLSTSSFSQVLHWLSKPQSQLGPIFNDTVLDAKTSANGRFILFRSAATNVVANPNMVATFGSQLYLYDRLHDTVKWVDESFGSLNFFEIIEFSAPTSDGTLMAFKHSSDIGFGTNGDHLYTMNLVTGEVRLISQDANAVPFEVPRIFVSSFVLTDGGNQLFFTTLESLLPEHTSGVENIYRVDLSTNEFSLISVSDDDSEASNSITRTFSVSPSGRYVLFSSAANNLVTQAVTGSNLYLRDTQNLTTELVTVQPSGQASMVDEADGFFSVSNSVSNLGTVLFLSNKSDLVNSDNNQRSDLFLYENGSNTRINLDVNGNELSGTSLGFVVQINAAGNLLYFEDSYSYVAADTDDQRDIYQFNLNSDTFTLVQPNVESVRFGLLGISADGQQVLFDTSSGGEANENASLSHALFGGLFITDTTTGAVEQIEPVELLPQTILSRVDDLFMSSDQRYAVFSSSSPNLAGVIENDVSIDTFFHDRLTDESVILGRLAVSEAISPNGRYVVLGSNYFQPEGIIEAGFNLYLHDRVLDSYTQIASGIRAQVNDFGVVVFETTSDLIPQDNNGVSDIYLFDANSNSISLLSQSAGGDLGNALSERAYINNDSAQVSVVFASDASNLITADINNTRDIFMADWPSGSVTRISQTTAQVGGDSFSYLADISNDGQVIAFASFSDNLTNDDFSNGLANIFLYERASQNITLVSKDDMGEPLSNDFFDLNISDAGNFITFSTDREIEFLEGDIGINDIDVFMIDVNTQTLSLISQPLDGSDDIVATAFSSRVYEDLSLSPPRVGVSFITNIAGSDILTGIFNHPGFNEAFLYQQGGPDVMLDVDVVGAGSVSGSFGLSCMSSCDFNYALGTEINLIASPDPGFIFDRWSSSRGQCTDDNNPCILLMDQDKQIQAIFIDPADIIFSDGFE